MYRRPVDDVVPPVTKTEKLGSYTLTSVLASGAQAMVHRARVSNAQDSAEEYAIKRLQRRHANDAEAQELLVATGRAGLKVCASNVVRILQVHERPEPFLVMECIEGANLQVLMRAARHTEIARFVVPVLLDVLEGLQDLHELRTESGAAAGLVHGAPCARHILVGFDGVARLTDLMHAIGPTLPWSPSRDRRLVASEMAPEQALAPLHVDARCDLFIVGGVFWQALTGKPLFAADDVQASLRNMLRKSIPAPSEAGAGVGRCFDRVCLRALQRTRGERYGSAAEMAHDLRDHAQQAGLCASREEIGAWVQLLLNGLPKPLDRSAPATGRTTIVGIGAFEDSAPAAAAPTSPASIASRASRLIARFARVPAGTQTVQQIHAISSVEPVAVIAGVPSETAIRERAKLAGDVSPSVARVAPGLRSDGGRPADRIEALRSGETALSDAHVQLSKAGRSNAFTGAPAAGVRDRPSRGNRDQLVSVLDPPTAWREPQPSTPPARVRRRSSSVNKSAMLLGIAIALTGPVAVLVYGDEFVSSHAPPEGQSAPREKDVPAHIPAAEQAVQNGTREAFVQQENLQRAAAQAPAAILPAPKEIPRAARAERAMNEVVAPAATGRARPQAHAIRPIAERRATAARGRKRAPTKQTPEEPLPHNPY
jgi:hypothetical protein